jgi:hypothetical protein
MRSHTGRGVLLELKEPIPNGKPEHAAQGGQGMCLVSTLLGYIRRVALGNSLAMSMHMRNRDTV